MKKALVTAIIFSLLLASCGLIKKVRILKEGEVEQQSFKSVIPFEYRLGLIIVKVSIEGTEYDFLLDTGAPNVISPDLAKKLNLEPRFSNASTDSQGEKSELDFVTVSKINIGGLNFLNSAAAVADLKKSNMIACIEVDGLIGSNLMRKALWEFDFQNQEIYIASSIDSFNIIPGSKKVEFSPSITGTPKTDITMDGVKEKWVTIDFGSNGYISSSEKILKKLQKNNKAASSTFGYGSMSAGIFGAGKMDTIEFAKTSDISIGEISLKNQVVSFKPKGSTTIGMKFLKNYNVILNWYDKEMIMSKTTDFDHSNLNEFGIKPAFDGNNIFINFIYNESGARKAGLELGDQIILVNGIEYCDISQDVWCNLVEMGFLKNNETLSLTILRGDEELSYDLIKTIILD